jgi:hypothetical protein
MGAVGAKVLEHEGEERLEEERVHQPHSQQQ